MRAIRLALGLVAIGSLFACNGKVAGGGPEEPPAGTWSKPAPGSPGDLKPAKPQDPYASDLSVPGYPAGSACTAKLTISDCATESGYEVNQHTFTSADTGIYYLGVYETKSSYGASHITGKANVTDRAPHPHTLVLTAYEATQWNVVKAPGSGLERIITSGYYAPTVIVDGSVIVEDHSGPGASVCGYSYPYNGQGCDTDEAVAAASSWAGGDVAQMAGCYQAATFVVDADCVAPTPTPNPPPPPGQDLSFVARDFKHDDTTSGCRGGAMYVAYNAQYGKWVGAELCSETSYKLYLAESQDGEYAPIADGGGHGQDHCELVNPAFTITNDDDVTSGSCKDCSVTPWDIWRWPGAVPVYVRSQFGTPFTLETWSKYDEANGPVSPHHTSSQYSCGVRIPQ